MLNAGQAGFVNAPVSKTLVVGVVSATVLASISGAHGRLALRPAALARGEAWRLATHHAAFDTPGELLFGGVLLYFFRQTERQLGSSRFLATLLAAAALHTALLLAALALPFALPAPASGPYAAVGALAVQFFFDTPKIYAFTVLHSVPLSDKSFPYLLHAQLLISGLPSSLVPALTSLLAGLLLRLPLCAHLRMPAALESFATSALLPLLDTAPRRRARRARRPPPPPPVATLTAMGFSREQASAALAEARGDVQRATELLLARAR